MELLKVLFPKMKNILLCLLFTVFLFPHRTAANDKLNTKRNSIINILAKVNNLNRKADLLNQLSEIETSDGQYKLAIHYGKQADSIAQKNNNLEGRFRASLNLGIAERKAENYKNSLIYLNKAFFFC